MDNLSISGNFNKYNVYILIQYVQYNLDSLLCSMLCFECNVDYDDHQFLNPYQKTIN